MALLEPIVGHGLYEVGNALADVNDLESRVS